MTHQAAFLELRYFIRMVELAEKSIWKENEGIKYVENV
jgi:hypothetical protein